MHNRIFRTTTLAAVFALSSVAFAAGTAQAQQAAPAAPAAQAQAQQRSILDELNLTQDQQTKIRDAMQSNLQQLRPQLQTVMQRREAFESTQPGSSGYQAAVTALAQSESDFARSRAMQEGALRTTINGILTPAQRTKLQQLLAEQQARVRQMQQQAQQPAAAPAASH